MEIREFILARIEGLDHDADGIADVIYMSWNGEFMDDQLEHLAQGFRDILDLHNSWTVALETKPKMELDPGPYNPLSTDAYVMRMSQQIGFVTEQKYREHFGTEPPTAPMIRAIAKIWRSHPDYQEDWN